MNRFDLARDGTTDQTVQIMHYNESDRTYTVVNVNSIGMRTGAPRRVGEADLVALPRTAGGPKTGVTKSKKQRAEEAQVRIKKGAR